MALAAILAGQVAVMFLLLATGICIQKAGIADEKDARAISNILLMAIIPVLLVRAFQQPLNVYMLPALGMMAAFSMAGHLIAIFFARHWVSAPHGNIDARNVSRLAVVLSNAGFMGFPLLSATIGESGLMYGAVFLGMFNIASWAWSVPTLTNGAQRLSPIQLMKNPSIIGFFFGAILYLLQLRLPNIASVFVQYLANINTPLSMLVVGIFLAKISPKDLLSNRHIYWIVFLRNIFLPMVMLLLLWLMRISAWLPDGKNFGISFMILCACPSAAACILMPARYHSDSSHGAKLVTVSTVFSILTLPLIAGLADLIL